MFVSVFQKAINVGGGIDNLILNFTPPPTAHGPDYIPGTDQSATDNVLKPLMKAVKIAFYHWRRDERKTKKRLVILVAEGAPSYLSLRTADDRLRYRYDDLE